MANATNFSSSGADTENIGVIITKTTICMFLLALSLAENSLVLLIFKLNFRNRLRSTNCYFIANMSLADLLFAVQNLPHAYNNFVFNGHWVLRESVGLALCKVDVFFSLISMVTTNLTILAISVDRYFAVFMPYKKLITRRICFLIIFLTWFISTVFASPLLYYSTLVERGFYTTCTLSDGHVLKLWYTILAGILTTTLVIMLVLYTAVGLKIWQYRSIPGNPTQATLARREKQNREIFKMLITLVVVFYVCFLPFVMLSLSHLFGFYFALKRNYGRFTVLVLYFMNAVINPMIYYIFNESFREGFRSVLAKAICRNRGTVHSVERPLTPAVIEASGRTPGKLQPTVYG